MCCVWHLMSLVHILTPASSVIINAIKFMSKIPDDLDLFKGYLKSKKGINE